MNNFSLSQCPNFCFAVSRLMGSSAASANMGHGLNTGMPGLGACAMPDSKPMQFPLAQRRKRRVLFTQAQVGQVVVRRPHPSPASSGLSNYRFHRELKYYIAVGGSRQWEKFPTRKRPIPVSPPVSQRRRCCRSTSWRGGSSSRSICQPLSASIWPPSSTSHPPR